MRSNGARSLDVSADPTRMMTKFMLPNAPAIAEAPTPTPTPPESGVVEVARETTAMPVHDSVRLLAASMPTPLQEIAPVPIAPAPAAPKTTGRSPRQVAAFRLLAATLPTPLEEMRPVPIAPVQAPMALESGAWQAAVLALTLSAAFLVGAKIVGVLLF